MQPGESDPAVRDTRVLARPGNTTFQACVVSDRHRDMASVELRVAFLSPATASGRGSYVWAGSRVDQARRLLAPVGAASPRFVTVLSAQVGDAPATGAIALELAWSPCRDDEELPCTALPRSVRALPTVRLDWIDPPR
jgi:hypothetical protein